MARSIRIFGHPLHPATTHLPMGLLVALPAWDALGMAWVEGPWWTIAYWTGIAGCVMAVPAMLAGMLDARAVPAHVQLLAIAHGLTMVGIVAAFLVSLLALHGAHALPHAVHPLAAILADAAASVALLVGGWLGGQLVYSHGVGVADDPHAGQSGHFPPP